MIGYCCYFDTLKQAILLKMMKQIMKPELLRRAVYCSKTEEVHQVHMKNAVGTKMKVVKGAAQRGELSPWKSLVGNGRLHCNGTEGSRKSLKDNLIKTEGTGIVAVMFADDSIAQGLKHSKMQMQFDFCCLVSAQDDAIISFKTSEYLIFNLEDDKAFVNKVLVNESGEIKSTKPDEEFEVVTTKYCGFWIQAKGFNIHVKKAVAKMKVANAMVLKSIVEVGLVVAPTRLHRQLYIAKVRSVAQFGGEIYGVETYEQLNTVEYVLLKTVVSAHWYPKKEMLWFWLKLLRLPAINTMQVFRFWVYVVKDGDELEKACLQYSMKRALAKYDSWFAKFVNKIHGLLWWKKHFPKGIRDCIVWRGEGAKKMQKHLKRIEGQRCEALS